MRECREVTMQEPTRRLGAGEHAAGSAAAQRAPGDSNRRSQPGARSGADRRAAHYPYRGAAIAFLAAA
jgi:hypothetical protein